MLCLPPAAFNPGATPVPSSQPCRTHPSRAAGSCLHTGGAVHQLDQRAGKRPCDRDERTTGFERRERRSERLTWGPRRAASDEHETPWSWKFTVAFLLPGTRCFASGDLRCCLKLQARAQQQQDRAAGLARFSGCVCPGRTDRAPEQTEENAAASDDGTGRSEPSRPSSTQLATCSRWPRTISRKDGGRAAVAGAWQRRGDNAGRGDRHLREYVVVHTRSQPGGGSPTRMCCSIRSARS